MEEEEAPLPIENKEPDPKSVYGESDMISILEDRNDWDAEPSETGGKYKSTRRCFNEKCQSTTGLKKLRSKAVANRYRNFCKPCYQSYINCQFCEFCEQVYGNQAVNQEDDNDWIGCDQCDRWNHIVCEAQKRNKNARLIKQQNRPYLCKGCANQTQQQKIQVKKPKVTFVEDDYYHYQRPVKKRTARQIINHEKNQEYTNANPDSVNIFARPREGSLYLDSFLNTIISYKLHITDIEIKDDIRRIKEGVITKQRRQYSKGNGYDKGK